MNFDGEQRPVRSSVGVVVVVAQEYPRESVGATRTSAARHLGKIRPAGLAAERLTEVCRLRLIGLLA